MVLTIVGAIVGAIVGSLLTWYLQRHWAHRASFCGRANAGNLRHAGAVRQLCCILTACCLSANIANYDLKKSSVMTRQDAGDAAAGWSELP